MKLYAVKYSGSLGIFFYDKLVVDMKECLTERIDAEKDEKIQYFSKEYVLLKTRRFRLPDRQKQLMLKVLGE